eukprot:4392519-Pyramimonas_sp.AAC.1
MSNGEGKMPQAASSDSMPHSRNWLRTDLTGKLRIVHLSTSNAGPSILRRISAPGAPAHARRTFEEARPWSHNRC